MTTVLLHAGERSPSVQSRFQSFSQRFTPSRSEWQTPAQVKRIVEFFRSAYSSRSRLDRGSLDVAIHVSGKRYAPTLDSTLML
ncbi:hypothetical protein [Paraburkholderia caribensis]|uniref:hypothetical protein n=1 Tax=Paraburkholderia caribensis TaxID=75105 RepID=UPI0012E7849A|nr:hypothetical protein [Paraburkholderia caribensis]